MTKRSVHASRRYRSLIRAGGSSADRWARLFLGWLPQRPMIPKKEMRWSGRWNSWIRVDYHPDYSWQLQERHKGRCVVVKTLAILDRPTKIVALGDETIVGYHSVAAGIVRLFSSLVVDLQCLRPGVRHDSLSCGIHGWMGLHQ